MLVSQGVISRNYDDSQYNGFDSWLIKKKNWEWHI
jgi:hypothetical protein